MDTFLLKKLISSLIMPLPLISLLLCLGLLALLRGKSKGASWFIGCAVALLLLISTPWLPNTLLGEVEQQYHQYDQSQAIDTIVILGCGHINDGTLPLTAQLYPCSMIRIAEAARIHRLNPHSQIITSGAASDEPFSNAEMNKHMLIALGVAAHKITAIAKSRDTEDESVNLAPRLQNKTVALVTSASHMSRSLRLFARQGVHPVPAPTEHLVRRSGNDSAWWAVLPSSKNIAKIERWWHEWLGQQWLSIKALLPD